MWRFSIVFCLLVTLPAHGESFQEIKEKAEQGDIRAYYQLGNFYFFGKGIVNNTSDSFF